MNQMCCSSCLFIAADQYLGKVDKASHSQQTLMELLISGITANKSRICDTKEEPPEAAEWTGVECDETDEIIGIDWSWKSLKGSIEFIWLPFSSKNVNLTWNVLGGTADLTCLPDGLQVLTLGSNRFEGTVDLTQLPESLETLYLYGNDFRGKTDFSKIPKSLRDFDVENTNLEGEIFEGEFDGVLRCANSQVEDVRHKRWA